MNSQARADTVGKLRGRRTSPAGKGNALLAKEIVLFVLQAAHLSDHHAAILSSIFGNTTQRLLQRALQEPYTGCFPICCAR
jgi:hypothetical protein